MYLRHSHKAISHLPLVQNFASETTPYHSYTFYPWYKIGFELLNILKALHGLPLPALCPMSQAPACAPPENPSCLPPQSPYILGVSQGVSKFSKTTPYCPTESRGSRVPSLLKFQSTASIIITVTAKLKKSNFTREHEKVCQIQNLKFKLMKPLEKGLWGLTIQCLHI